jgi:hypothetical protein
MQSTTKRWQSLPLLACVVAGIVTWLLLHWLASRPVSFADSLGSLRPVVERVIDLRGALVYLMAAWGLLAGWRKGLPPFAPLLLCGGAVATIAAHGSASILVGVSCLLVGALVAKPQSVPVAVRRCLALSMLLVLIACTIGL